MGIGEDLEGTEEQYSKFLTAALGGTKAGRVASRKMGTAGLRSLENQNTILAFLPEAPGNHWKILSPDGQVKLF